MYFSNCKELDLRFSTISDVTVLSHISVLILYCCRDLVDASPLKDAKYLDLSHCSAIKDVSMLGNVKILILTDCTSITDINRLDSVKYLDITGLHIAKKYFLNKHSLKMLWCSNTCFELITTLDNKESINYWYLVK
jgi:hypothetical protein